MESLQKVIEWASHWLLDQQDEASGCWPDRSGMQPNTLNTAEAMVALIDSDVSTAGSTPIQKGVKYLLQHQIFMKYE